MGYKEHSPLKLKSLDEYKMSALVALKEQVEKHFLDISLISVEDIDEKIDLLNAYPRLDKLQDISKDEIFVLDENNIDISEAEKVVLDGEFFFEHACAGEATRLGLGTKYLLNLKTFTLDNIADLMLKERIKNLDKDKTLSEDEKRAKFKELKKTFTPDRVKEWSACDPKDLADITLGKRHMLQLAYDIKNLAIKHGLDYKKVLKKQSMLIILNEHTSERIISEFIKDDFYMFDNKKVFFMIQQAIHGIDIIDGKFSYDSSNDEARRLHNHGQMFMQKTHDDLIFYIDTKKGNKKVYLKSKDFEEVLKKHKDLLSYNIEDISYLTSSIDYPALAKALKLGKKGYKMVMEIVSQNKILPQKGGAAFYDPVLKRNVMIESNRLLDIRNEEITYLNKNFNHYPSPAKSYKKVKETGIHIHFDVKKDKDGKHYIYPCPVQGDINFLVKTAFLMRKELKPISNWKSPATTPPTIKAMYEQDNQPGFLDFAKSILKKEI